MQPNCITNVIKYICFTFAIKFANLDIPRLEVVNLVKHILFCKSVQFFTMLTEMILFFSDFVTKGSNKAYQATLRQCYQLVTNF